VICVWCDMTEQVKSRLWFSVFSVVARPVMRAHVRERRDRASVAHVARKERSDTVRRGSGGDCNRRRHGRARGARLT
jgi:hypothetical protein